MKTHVVVTVYTPTVGKRVIHAYGPYTGSKAKTEANKLRREFRGKGLDFTASACKMLDVEM